MYDLRHKKLTRKNDAGSGGSNQTACSAGGIQSKRGTASNSKRRGAANTRKSERRSVDDTVGCTKWSGTAAVGSAERGNIAAARSTERGSTATAGSAERDDGGLVATWNTETSNADVNNERTVAAPGSTERIVNVTGNIERRANGAIADVDNTEMRSANADGNTERRVAAASITERRANGAIADVNNTEMRSANADRNMERGGSATGNTERRISSAGVHSRIVASNSERTSIVRGDDDACRRATTDINSRLSGGSGGVNSNLNIGSKRGCQAPAKRGRAKMARTELAVPPRSGRVELEPSGESQFKYVGYNPKCYKYPSQVGVILKREYPGIIKVYDDDGTVIKRQPAFTWNDYYWKKDEHGICYAKKVKAEF